MEIIIREVEIKDYPALLSLWNNELGFNYVTIDNIAPHYNRVKDDARYKTYVALLKEEVVGFVSSAQTYAVGYDGSSMQIIALAVKTDKQNQGIGSQLIRRMESYAIEENCYCIGLCSGFKRADAHAFYERKGFEKGSYAFVKMLNPVE